MGLSGMVAVIMDSQGLPLPLTLLAALGIGLVTGLINAYYVYKGLAPYIIPCPRTSFCADCAS